MHKINWACGPYFAGIQDAIKNYSVSKHPSHGQSKPRAVTENVLNRIFVRFNAPFKSLDADALLALGPWIDSLDERGLLKLVGNYRKTTYQNAGKTFLEWIDHEHSAWTRKEKAVGQGATIKTSEAAASDVTAKVEVGAESATKPPEAPSAPGEKVSDELSSGVSGLGEALDAILGDHKKAKRKRGRPSKN